MDAELVGFESGVGHHTALPLMWKDVHSTAVHMRSSHEILAYM
jgi:hypothetical protein